MAAPDQLARSLVDAALELHRRRLWLEAPPDALFQVRLPGEEHPLVATILGQDGNDFGMLAVRGPAAFARMVGIVTDDEHWIPDFDETAVLDVGMDPLHAIPAPFRRWLELAGFSTRRENLAPRFAVFVPEQETRPANRTEARLLLAAIRAVLASHDAGEFRPFRIDGRRRRILELLVEGEGRGASTSTSLVPWPASAPAVAEVRSASPRTLEQWKEADRIATTFLLEQARSSGSDRKRPMERYFGSEEDAEDVLVQLDAHHPLQGYVEWFAADYRATKRSKTLLEKLLSRKSLEPWDRILFETRATARLSIFRVLSAMPGSHLVVEDVLDGTRHTVHDRSLSSGELRGAFLPMRLSRVAEWTFAALAGPILSGMHVDHALAMLQTLGVEMTPDGARKSAHLFGRLWQLLLSDAGRPPTLCNTDGEPTELQTASFEFRDADALERALDAREDVELDEQSEGWVWWKPGALEGSQTLLGRLTVVDDRLVLDVNSAARLARAREWLERIPGVVFERATARPLDRDALPLDDRLPYGPDEPPPPELIARIEDMYLQYCLAWLDQPVPILGGISPRQACATPAGRRAVERLIRTMPPMDGPGGDVEPPRAEMLRELGFATDA
jgi:hypothetical protein